MSEILNFNTMKKQQYENRAITIKHSLLPTMKQEQFTILIKVTNDRMFGRIGLSEEMTFGLELEFPLTGEKESEAAAEMEQNLIVDMVNAISERESNEEIR